MVNIVLKALLLGRAKDACQGQTSEGPEGLKVVDRARGLVCTIQEPARARAGKRTEREEMRQTAEAKSEASRMGSDETHSQPPPLPCENFL